MSDEDESYDEEVDSDEEEDDEEDSDEEEDEGGEEEDNEQDLQDKQRKVAMDLERLNEVCQQMDHIRLRLRSRYPLANGPTLNTSRDALRSSSKASPSIPQLPLSGSGLGSKSNRERESGRSSRSTSSSTTRGKKTRRNSFTPNDVDNDDNENLNQYGPSSNVNGRYYNGGPSSRRTSTSIKVANRSSETQTETARSRNSMSQTEATRKRDSSVQTMSPEEMEKSEKKLAESMEKIVTSLSSSTFSSSRKHSQSQSQNGNSQVRMFTTDDLEASGEGGGGKGIGINSGTQSSPMGVAGGAGYLHQQRGGRNHGRRSSMKEFDMYSHDSLEDEEENYRHMSPMKRNELIQQAIKVLLTEDGMVDGARGGGSGGQVQGLNHGHGVNGAN